MIVAKLDWDVITEPYLDVTNHLEAPVGSRELSCTPWFFTTASLWLSPLPCKERYREVERAAGPRAARLPCENPWEEVGGHSTAAAAVLCSLCVSPRPDVCPASPPEAEFSLPLNPSFILPISSGAPPFYPSRVCRWKSYRVSSPRRPDCIKRRQRHTQTRSVR